jgi:hypothetical protein
MIIETRWWDVFLVWVRYHDGTLDVRLGAVCLLLLLLLLSNAVAAFVKRHGGPPSTA